MDHCDRQRSPSSRSGNLDDFADLCRWRGDKGLIRLVYRLNLPVAIGHNGSRLCENTNKFGNLDVALSSSGSG
jgi:hypothetical protein